MDLMKSDATPDSVDRGRQKDDRHQQQLQLKNQPPLQLQSAAAEAQAQRAQLEVCPGLVSRERERGRSDPEPRPGDAAGDDGLLAAEKTSRGVQNKGCPGTTSHGLPGKRKHRRRASKKKRRWKPYFKLSWEEKKELDERETARAARVRAEMFAKGLPVAPYNTTQFLMEEHDREEPDLNTELCGRFEDSGSEDEHCEPPEDGEDLETVMEEEEGEGSDGMGRPGHGAGGPGGGAAGGGEFLQRDFSETYERYHVETLQNMSKQELVREYLELEKCMSRLEEENNRLEQRSRRSAGSVDESAQRRVRELESEVERLRAQNRELLLSQQQKLNGSRATEHEPELERESP
ncbi:protein HEXIM1 [Hoplias malabaricus]|uniref:protein HEXIM1 n=1 Tax=Hoplias malabaricus TaxID=27720 RepID=UPI0034635C91